MTRRRWWLWLVALFAVVAAVLVVVRSTGGTSVPVADPVDLAVTAQGRLVVLSASADGARLQVVSTSSRGRDRTVLAGASAEQVAPRLDADARLAGFPGPGGAVTVAADGTWFSTAADGGVWLLDGTTLADHPEQNWSSLVQLAALDGRVEGVTASGELVRIEAPGTLKPESLLAPAQAQVPGSAPLPPDARFDAVALGPEGRTYVLDPTRNQVFVRSSDGRVDLVAGSAERTRTAEGPGTAANDVALSPVGITVDSAGRLVILDNGRLGLRLRLVEPDGTITRGQAKVPLGAARLTSGPDGRLYVLDRSGREVVSWSDIDGADQRTASLR